MTTLSCSIDPTGPTASSDADQRQDIIKDVPRSMCRWYLAAPRTTGANEADMQTTSQRFRREHEVSDASVFLNLQSLDSHM
eukprot:SM000082S22850  [mRNA]  locus=s82:248346:248918:- [translate_table: standard]